MRIVVINNGYPDEGHPSLYVFVHNQVKALRETGHEVYVVDIDLRSMRWKRRLGIGRDVYEGVPVLRISFPFVTVKLRGMGRRLNELFGVWAVKRLQKEYGPIDIVHCHFGFGAGNAGAKVKQALGIPLVITEHSTRILLSKSRDEISWLFQAYPHAGQVIAVGQELKRRLSAYGCERLTCVANVLDTDLFCPRKVSKFEEFTFLSVGHLISRKGHDLTLEAMKQLKDEGEACRLIIVGRGPERERLLYYTQRYGLASITWLDQVKNTELPSLYSQCHCFVLPSREETFGVVYAEAIACGLPVIATKTGGSVDIINPENGVLVAKDNVVELARAMKQMLHNAGRYAPDQLHSDMEKRFGKQAFLNAVEPIYKRLVSERA